MTVKELFEILEEMVECGAGHFEVKLLMQPNYPLIYSIGSVGVRKDEEVLYLAEGQYKSYGFPEEELETFEI